MRKNRTQWLLAAWLTGMLLFAPRETPAMAQAHDPGSEKTARDIALVWIPEGRMAFGTDLPALAQAFPGLREEWVADEAGRRPYQGGGFWMSRTEITRRDWIRVMGTEPWKERGKDERPDPGLPATWVTLEEARDFAERLGEVDGMTFRLPTEEEWEYACRAGATSVFPFGDDPLQLPEHAWFRANAADGMPRAVGGLRPNLWGLYDMLGNVWEWCDAPYPSGGAKPERALAVIKGGSTGQIALQCRPGFRLGRQTDQPGPRVGFRVILAPPKR